MKKARKSSGEDEIRNYYLYYAEQTTIKCSQNKVLYMQNLKIGIKTLEKP